MSPPLRLFSLSALLSAQLKNNVLYSCVCHLRSLLVDICTFFGWKVIYRVERIFCVTIKFGLLHFFLQFLILIVRTVREKNLFRSFRSLFCFHSLTLKLEPLFHSTLVSFGFVLKLLCCLLIYASIILLWHCLQYKIY